LSRTSDALEFARQTLIAINVSFSSFRYAVRPSGVVGKLCRRIPEAIASTEDQSPRVTDWRRRARLANASEGCKSIALRIRCPGILSEKTGDVAHLTFEFCNRGIGL